ncbi:MAG: bifunctional nicotinamidase/pyrazinamidase [Gammaproteobacteria bacterium]|nr:bifunctional nicotinamidase/pyrazinamidase [Gammaproteobacteria bacterium]
MSPSERSALLVVDIQPDFLPGGALAVADGDVILAPLRQLLEARRFAHVIATQDWHPAGHVSFASSHPGRTPFDRIELYGREQVLWPDHCVQGTPGAALHPQMPWSSVDAVIRKGTDPRVDSYSTFRNNWDERGERPPTGLAGYLRERGVSEVFICGLARDYCVCWSAEDAIAAGFDTTVIWDLTRSVDPSGDRDLRRALEARGVRIGAANAFG